MMLRMTTATTSTNVPTIPIADIPRRKLSLRLPDRFRDGLGDEIVRVVHCRHSDARVPRLVLDAQAEHANLVLGVLDYRARLGAVVAGGAVRRAPRRGVLRRILRDQCPEELPDLVHVRDAERVLAAARAV